ncbi:hypothetical protein GGR52DRAFT_581416 [Hypoxylon sp. FL1284]|nr:hypothetical protein GGR52DRAFT_581416 [Hypoxylon sp. FL1284]
MEGPAPSSPPCQKCRSLVKTFVCVQCNNLAFCAPCWTKWPLHVPGATGLGGKPHEKADPEIVHRLQQIFEPIRSEAAYEAELLKDRETTWFGFSRDSSGHPIFQDYGRFAAIMSESRTRESNDRYPQLVSFIGETGAGKSTLLKLLIERQGNASLGNTGYYSPVTSSNSDCIPTTGDVHLYAEPSTISTSTPLLLIDSEGLNGGEAEPKALRSISRDVTASPAPESSPSRVDMKKLLQFRHSSRRYISWASSPQTQKRGYTVSQLYPRILYAFSDVVVFVLRNPRSFESVVLDKLIRWASASVDKSLNQPVLPHAILVLNATEDVDDEEWDTEVATTMLMSAIQDAITRDPVLNEYVKTWSRRGREIKTTLDLLRQYYASVTVIRVPRRGSYMLMDQQVKRLFELIKACCSASHLTKKQARMLANADMLQVYLHASFEHFTRDLDSPFDFVKEALRHSPVPRSFEGSILNLAVSMKNHSRSEEVRNDARKIFLQLVPMVASCIMLDTARQRILGTAPRLLSDAYAELFESALQRFADFYWPCSFHNQTYEHGRCCNVKSGHDPKGHQNNQGKIIGNGSYQSDFDLEAFVPEWNRLIREDLVRLQAAVYEFSQRLPGRTDSQLVSILHRDRISNFYRTLGNQSDFVSHSACFSCLRELPDYVLPCGHVLCLSCVRTYGSVTSRTTVELKRCPLHVRDIVAEPPWVITMKPPSAGVRVLCLDSGGINGIVQLEVLRVLEKALGPQLPIQLFFDLIVGTGMGGVIALGLGSRGWSVEKAIKKFKALAKAAFTPREMTSVPLLGNLTALFHGSLYKTRPFERALNDSFSSCSLFWGVQSRNKIPVKVAVTATTALERKAVIFGNYNRPDSPDQNLPYEFVRPDEPLKEIKAWEAARATSAMGPHFKAFFKPETKDQYVDGSLHHACPVWVAHHEAKLIWGDVAHLPLDVMVSIGTGRHVKEKDKAQTGRSRRDVMATPSAISLPLTKLTGPPFLSKSTRRADKIHDYANGDRIWDRFMAGEFTPNSAGFDSSGHYIRISPELNIPTPRLDDIERLDEVGREAGEALEQTAHEMIKVVHRLIATTFFFEVDYSSVRQSASDLSGSILCRFRNSTDEMKALGKLLRSYMRGNFEPQFFIEDDVPGSATQQIVLSGTVVRDMHHHGCFDMEPIQISLPNEYATTKIMLRLQPTPYAGGGTAVPISGFPRQLMSEDGGSTSRSSIQSCNMQTRASLRSPSRRPSEAPRSSDLAAASNVVEPMGMSSSHLEPMAELPESPAIAELPSDQIHTQPTIKHLRWELPEMEGSLRF